eukprot:2124129-Rhodomonas_salina.2
MIIAAPVGISSPIEEFLLTYPGTRVPGTMTAFSTEHPARAEFRYTVLTVLAMQIPSCEKAGNAEVLTGLVAKMWIFEQPE